jgi:hypothetical protein
LDEFVTLSLFFFLFFFFCFLFFFFFSAFFRCGSGVIISLLATLLPAGSRCFATDVNPRALEVAARTAAVYGVAAHIA